MFNIHIVSVILIIKYHRHFIMILYAVYVMLPKGIKQAVPPLPNISSGDKASVNDTCTLNYIVKNRPSNLQILNGQQHTFRIMCGWKIILFTTVIYRWNRKQWQTHRFCYAGSLRIIYSQPKSNVKHFDLFNKDADFSFMKHKKGNTLRFSKCFTRTKIYNKVSSVPQG